ncbi:MAG: peptidoglycan DD-metalloendopeptidase family protein [Burkholderiales bacterium]|nr:peptidoglycan DD-metalloendopeptidase family protein [Burkholderiales bacterium]
MHARTWLVFALTAIATAGCVTRTQAPVADRQPPAPAAARAEPARPPAGGADTYVVRQGDTLYSIAVANGIDPRELAALNGIGDPSKIQVGQVLTLRAAPAAPVTETAVVTVNPVTGSAPIEARPLGATIGPAPGSVAPGGATAPGAPATGAAPAPSTVIPGLKTGPKVAKLPYSEQNLALLQRGDAAPPAPAAAARPEPPPAAPAAAPKPPATGDDAIDWGWPAAGRVVAGFQENGSKGLSIAGKRGDPVYATAGGQVVYSGEGLANYGKLIIVKHNDKYLSVYAHNSAILVKEKQSVAKGQKIAEIGTTGAAGDQPRLHFEIRRFGKPVDPQQFLPSRP